MAIPSHTNLRRIPASAQAAMERMFGHSFDDIWMVVGDAPEAIGARAFAYGKAVFLTESDAALDTAERWGILGHELTHVLQQSNGRVAMGRPWVHDDEALEQEADTYADLAERAFMELLAPERGPLRPVRAVVRPVIQPVMKLEDFQNTTKSRMIRSLDRIAPIDTALKQFHALDVGKKKDYVALSAQAKVLHNAARKFLDDKPEANRRDAVLKLSQQIAIEGAYLDLLGQYQEETDDLAQFKILEKAQEFVRRNIAAISATRGAASPEVNDLINLHSMEMKKSGGRDSLLVLRDIEKLKKLVSDPMLPGIMKSVILETTSAANLQQIDASSLNPGLKYNKTRGPGTKKYTLNHNMSQHMGRRFRMGSLLHELTHLSVAETFDNTVLMLSIRKDATKPEILALASQRRGLLMALKSEIETSNAVEGELKDELVGKVAYPIMGKFAQYLGAFKAQFKTPDEIQKHADLTALQKQGLDCELIEYDSVVNQMFLWLHMFGIDTSSGVYTKLQAMVTDAYRHRMAGKFAKLAKRPLPPPPVVPVGGPPRKPLPLPPPPVRR